MLDRVFHEKLDPHGRNLACDCFWACSDAESEAIFELDGFEVEIISDYFDLVLEGNGFALVVKEDVSEQVGQYGYHLACSLLVFTNECSNIVQTIEEEVRIDLSFEGSEGGVFGNRFQSPFVDFALSVVACVFDTEIDRGPKKQDHLRLENIESENKEAVLLTA